MFPSWPAWRYRAGEAKIFKTAEELAAAGDGWVDSPAKIQQSDDASTLRTELSEKEAVCQELTDQLIDNLEDMDKDDLQALATRSGIEFDARWGRTKLIAAIRG